MKQPVRVVYWVLRTTYSALLASPELPAEKVGRLLLLYRRVLDCEHRNGLSACCRRPCNKKREPRREGYPKPAATYSTRAPHCNYTPRRNQRDDHYYRPYLTLHCLAFALALLPCPVLSCPALTFSEILCLSLEKSAGRWLLVFDVDVCPKTIIHHIIISLYYITNLTSPLTRRPLPEGVDVLGQDTAPARLAPPGRAVSRSYRMFLAQPLIVAADKAREVICLACCAE